ncbi:MAG TPA: sensor histidine kinase [Glycomyces sp.]|nr:sensor histidine kinase [Glycomyces sp.]
MQTAHTRKRRPVRRFLSYLISTGPVGDGSWRFRFTTALALIGPGSVPFALLVFSTQNEVLRSMSGMDWGGVAAVLTGAAVVLGRFRPVVAWSAVMAAFFIIAFDTGEVGTDPWPMTTPGLFAFMVVQFALARDCRVWWAIAGWLGYLASGTWVMWAVQADALAVENRNPFAPYPDPSGDVPIPVGENLTLVATFAALVFVTGLSVRIWRQGRARVAEEEQVASAERGRRRILEERARIARELHDIVAHHMSVIAVQASTAEYRIEGVNEGAREEFRSISAQARESLAEMRRLLSVLRREDEAGEREPLPGPEALAGLVESVDRSGTPTTLEVAGLPEDLPETVALTVFRVAQEALSNVVRHAAGAETTVEVRGGGESVVVTVVNAAVRQGVASPESDGTGLGLVGMRERVVLVGGELEAGPTAEGGFRVRAELPLAARSDAEE